MQSKQESERVSLCKLNTVLHCARSSSLVGCQFFGNVSDISVVSDNFSCYSDSVSGKATMCFSVSKFKPNSADVIKVHILNFNS